jgi:hypothetical protein
LLFSVVLAGCQPVREDRSINWSSDGQAVGFQHGKEGVFVANQKGELTKIYQPDAEVLATSTPLWSPAGRRAIFTTARPRQGHAVMSIIPGLGDDPAGNLHVQQPVVYTCWMYAETPAGQAGKPVALFTAECDHVGYVAANLAVRWHPREERILFVQQVNGRHWLFEYDLASTKSTRVFPHGSDAMIFDWTPDGSHLVCVLGNKNPSETEMDGTWIGQPGTNDWWHVPRSSQFAQGKVLALLEQLRASRPAWTKDGTRFAFSSSEPAAMSGQPARYQLQLGVLATRETRLLEEGTEPYRDMHWRPDGQQLGVIRSSGDGSLVFVRSGGETTPAINRRPARRFAGWNAANNRWAYIAPDFIPSAAHDKWALLLLPAPEGRDVVLVRDTGDKVERELFSGMRVTFPQWSPQEDKLSLWVTFSPPYRSWVSQWLGWNLRPGDPAAIFDLKTRQFTWLAVNPQEKIQVGHYYLLKRDYATAWRWYEQAERELPPAKPVASREFLDYLRQMTGPRDFSFFEYYCLTKLNRPAEARTKLDQFKRLFLPEFSPQAADNQAVERWLQELLDPKGLWAPLLRDLYIAEVFLSLDAAADAEAFFRQSLAAASTDTARLSSALVLAQILLLDNKHAAYATVATETIGPLTFKLASEKPPATVRRQMDLQPFIDLIGQFSLAPLFVPTFVRGLPAKEVQEMIEPWKALRARAASDSSRATADRVLLAIFQRLGNEKERLEVARRLQANPQDLPELPQESDILKMREAIMRFLQGRWE